MTVWSLSGRNSPEVVEKPPALCKEIYGFKSTSTDTVSLHGHPSFVGWTRLCWTDEEIGVQGWEGSGPRSQRAGSRDETALDPTRAGWRFFLKAQPISSVWPGFAIEVARETGESMGPADLGCVGPQDTHRHLGCLAALWL